MKELKELPTGLRYSTIGEVIANAQSGFACGVRDEKGVIQLRMNNVSTDGGFVWEEFIRVPCDDESIARYKLFPGDIVFNNTNSTELVGKSALFQGFGEDVVYSNHFTRLRVKPDKCDPAYFSYWLNHLWKSRVFENICNRWIGQSAVKPEKLFSLKIPLPPLPEQRRIAAILTEQLAVVEQARKAAEAQLEAVQVLPFAYIKESLSNFGVVEVPLKECLLEIKSGIKDKWQKYKVLGATKNGAAPAKENIGKNPEKYKLVDGVTVFYNPMRILIGSIAMIEEDDEPGITSPDYVAVKGITEILDTRWFYYWFKSPYGFIQIQSLSRGAVRERILFNSLKNGIIQLPPYSRQIEDSRKMKQLRKIQDKINSEIEMITNVPAILLQQAFAGAI